MIHKKKAQIGMEYLMIVGFLTFVLIGTMGVAMYHNNSIRNLISSRQIDAMANKIISASESIYYAGEPSKTTFTTYIPKGIIEIEISEDIIFITFQTSTGINKAAFPSNVPITGSIPTISGLRKIIVEATGDSVTITS